MKNLITVEPSVPAASPQSVRKTIEQALERHPEHAAKHIQIAITDGKVILSSEYSPSTPFRRLGATAEIGATSVSFGTAYAGQR